VGEVFTAARAWLRRPPAPRAGVWATEIGWSVAGDGWVTVPVQTHGEYVPRTYQLAQASGQAANLSWHDFAHFMFASPIRAASPAPPCSATPAWCRASPARPSSRKLTLPGELRGLLFRRAGTEMLTLCAEHDTAFAFLKAPGADASAGLPTGTAMRAPSTCRLPAERCGDRSASLPGGPRRLAGRGHRGRAPAALAGKS